MSTSDPFDLPVGGSGLVNQVSAGTNTSPLGTSPGPGMLAGSSPGISPAAIAPIGAPTLPDPSDPAAMSLFLARLANEMFGAPGGTTVVPAPSPQQAMTGVGASVPASPGLSAGASPELAPVVTAPPTASPPPAPSIGSAQGLPGAPSGGGLDAIPQTPVAPGAPAVPQPPAEPMTLSLVEPVVVPQTPSAPQVPPASQTSVPQPSSSAPQPPTTQRAPLELSLLEPAAVSQPPSAPQPPAVPAAPNPFGAISFEGWDPGAFVELSRTPFLGEPTLDVGSPLQGLRPEQTPRIELLSHELAQPAVRDLGGTAFDPYAVRRDFPIFEERVHGKRLVWLDNAATTQKPRAVIDRLTFFYEHENSNIHRGAHTLAARATDAYETGREITARFLNAPSPEDVIFVRGATEGINLVAQSWGRRNVQRGDEVVITHLEHHANIVPWQQLCAETGARLRIAPVDDRGDVILEEYDRLLNPRTRLVAFSQVSNALGTITPARAMVEMAHRHGAVVLVDGAQAVSHMRVDVQALDCDFYVFSGHKIFAPTGIGAVFGKRSVLEHMPPWQGGGNMIQDVTFERTTYQPPPKRFEAGTGNIADAAGLGTALEYVMQIGMDVIGRYEHDLLAYATDHLRAVPGLTMIGTSANKAGVLSFVLNGYRNEEVGAALDQEGIAVRSGHHCAQPILRRFGLEGSVRASLAFYNVCEDIDALVATLHRLAGGR